MKLKCYIHIIARWCHIDAASRDAVRVAWLRLIHWKPKFYREATEWGLTKTPRTPRVIITLTTYPARIGLIHETINTLLTQAVKPDKIVLWLAESQFPNKEKDLPEPLLAQMKLGLEIGWCEDLRSYKKLLPALNKYPNDILITVDDDMFYPPNMVEELLVSYSKAPESIHTRAAVRIELDKSGRPTRYRSWKYVSEQGVPLFSNLLLGGTGTLYPPSSLDFEVLRSEVFQEVTPTTDDIWFWAMVVKNGRKIVVSRASGGLGCIPNYCANYDGALWNTNQSDEDGNDRQFAAVIGRYPRLADAISKESEQC